MKWKRIKKALASIIGLAMLEENSLKIGMIVQKFPLKDSDRLAFSFHNKYKLQRAIFKIFITSTTKGVMKKISNFSNF